VIAPLRVLQPVFHFARQRHGGIHIPLRKNAGMRQDVARPFMHQGTAPQPVQQLGCIRGVEQIIQGVALARADASGGDRQGSDVVIAQHDGDALAQRHDAAQRLGGLGPAIDQVAHEPQLARGVVCNFRACQQCVKLGAASMHIADHPDRWRSAHDTAAVAVDGWLFHGVRHGLPHRVDNHSHRSANAVPGAPLSPFPDNPS